MDLVTTNAKDEPTFALEYQASQAYGVEDLGAESWYKLVQRFKTGMVAT